MINYDVDQQGWGSRLTYDDYTKLPFTMDKVIIHYGGTTGEVAGVLAEAAKLRSWQNYHIDGKGWTDIAYAYAVGDSGVSYRLRGMNRSGATSGDYEGDGIPENEEALALVWIGGVPHQPSVAAFATMGRLVREAGQDVVIGHNDVKATGCPGPYWTAWIAQEGWKEGVEVDYRGVGNVPNTEWARGVVDWGIYSDTIITEDEWPDDWEDDAVTMGRIWTVLSRFDQYLERP